MKIIPTSVRARKEFIRPGISTTPFPQSVDISDPKKPKRQVIFVNRVDIVLHLDLCILQK